MIWKHLIFSYQLCSWTKLSLFILTIFGGISPLQPCNHALQLKVYLIEARCHYIQQDRSELSDNFLMYVFWVMAAVLFWFCRNILKLGMYTLSMLSTLSMRVAMMRSRSSKIPFLFTQFCEKVWWQQHQQGFPWKQANFSWCTWHHANTISLLWPNGKVFRSEGFNCTEAPLPSLENGKSLISIKWGGASGRRTTLACQKDNAWSPCDPSCGYFINLWVILIWHWVQNLKTSLWFKEQRGSCTKSKWLNTKSLTVL